MKVGDYLESMHPERAEEGDIVTEDGRKVGRHNGLFRYTVGQRRGLGISDTTPWYVTGLDSRHNRVIVGKDQDLFRDMVAVQGVHWISGDAPNVSRNYQVKLRSSHRGASARLEKKGDDRWFIHFEEPQRAISPGQFAVVYLDDEVLGAGEIV